MWSVLAAHRGKPQCQPQNLRGQVNRCRVGKGTLRESRWARKHSGLGGCGLAQEGFAEQYRENQGFEQGQSQLRWGVGVEEAHGPGSKNGRRGRKKTLRGLCPVGGEQNGGKDIRCPAEGSGLVLRAEGSPGRVSSRR